MPGNDSHVSLGINCPFVGGGGYFVGFISEEMQKYCTRKRQPLENVKFVVVLKGIGNVIVEGRWEKRLFHLSQRFLSRSKQLVSNFLNH